MSINEKSVARLNLVLVEPEIPQNAGNIGRTCVGLGARMHFVGKLGFSLEGRDIKRAGLDYWPKLDWRRHDNWDAFLKSLPDGADLALFSTHGRVNLWERAFRLPAYLVFGSESRGFPPSFHERYANQLVRIPVGDDIRSLNLAVAAGIAIYEAARQNNIVPEKL